MADAIKKYLILGAGYLGTYLNERLSDSSVLYSGRINTRKDAEEIISSYSPTLAVINCIGKTGNPNIDWCETNRRDTLISNVFVPCFIAEACKKLDINMINFGTGCIFESSTPIDDYATPNFNGSFYSRTKRMCEEALEEYSNVINFRIRMPISNIPSTKNILYKISKFHNVTDAPNSMTFLEDVVRAIPFVIEKGMYGNINLVHPTPFSIAEIKKYLGGEHVVVKQCDLIGVGPRADVIMCPKRLIEAEFIFKGDLEKTVEEFKNVI